MATRDEHARLLLACRRGNDAAARELYARHAPGLRAFARSILRDRASSDDALQGALCRMMSMPVRKLRAVRDGRAWLAGVVRNEALMMLRRQRRDRSREERAGSMRTPEHQPVDASEIGALLDGLPRREREVIVLRHAGGLSFQQIGVALGANPNTVASRYRRGLTRLREAMRKDGVRRGIGRTKEATHA